MQANPRSFQGRKLGLPSSPACTRPGRDAPLVEGHSRNQSQPVVFAPVRPLRPRRPTIFESVSVSADAAHVTREFTSRSGPRSVGTTFAAPTKNFVERSSTVSAASESSTASSLFQGRMMGVLSQRSSFTSLEDESEQSTKSVGTDLSLQTESSLRLQPHKDIQHSRYLSILEDGDSIWDRIAAAASILKVNVNKAWTSTINTSEEEETSPGCDSHLIRVMKAYHLAKALHPSDLPNWLFDERERKPSPSSGFTGSSRSTGFDVQPPRTSFSHIYDEAALRAPQVSHSRTASPVLPSSDKAGPSKATNRLKALRDAKRLDLGVRHVFSKSESSSYSPSRIHASVDSVYGVDRRDASSFRTRRPLQSVQQPRPGAF